MLRVFLTVANVQFELTVTEALTSMNASNRLVSIVASWFLGIIAEQSNLVSMRIAKVANVEVRAV